MYCHRITQVVDILFGGISASLFSSVLCLITEGVETTDALSVAVLVFAITPSFSFKEICPLLFLFSAFSLFLSIESDLRLSLFSSVFDFFDRLLSRLFSKGEDFGDTELITSERILLVLLIGRSRELLRLERRLTELSLLDLTGEADDDLKEEDLEDDLDKAGSLLESFEALRLVAAQLELREVEADVDASPDVLADISDLLEVLLEALDLLGLSVSFVVLVTPVAIDPVATLDVSVVVDPDNMLAVSEPSVVV